MSEDENKALERRYFKAYNKGKDAIIAATEELYSKDFVFHGATGEDIHGIKNTLEYVKESFSAFPDMRATIDDMVAEGDKVVVRFSATGTHKGEFMGVPATNKKVTMWAIVIDRFAHGKVVEEWERTDTLGLMQQLGLIPEQKK